MEGFPWETYHFCPTKLGHSNPFKEAQTLLNWLNLWNKFLWALNLFEMGPNAPNNVPFPLGTPRLNL